MDSVTSRDQQIKLVLLYRDFKDLARSTGSDKLLHNMAVNISKNPKYGRYQRGLSSMVYKYFHKKSADTSGDAN